MLRFSQKVPKSDFEGARKEKSSKLGGIVPIFTREGRKYQNGKNSEPPGALQFRDL